MRFLPVRSFLLRPVMYAHISFFAHLVPCALCSARAGSKLLLLHVAPAPCPSPQEESSPGFPLAPPALLVDRPLLTVSFAPFPLSRLVVFASHAMSLTNCIIASGWRILHRRGISHPHILHCQQQHSSECCLISLEGGCILL